ncbi:hypothetical protein HK096_005243, partial [Nowakowskiella sp. JEL0078]
MFNFNSLSQTLTSGLSPDGYLFTTSTGLTGLGLSFCFIQTNVSRSFGTCSTFWKYWLGAGCIYLFERVVREIRGRRSTHISKVVQHPSKVVEVQIKKPSIKVKSGQYVFLCCPEIAPFEWHPFTLTSAPEEPFVSVHIRVAGDWTTNFSKRLGCEWDPKTSSEKIPIFGDEAKKILPKIRIDGPYGTPSEDVFDFEISLCVGAGIGVTPYASILKSI